MEFLNCNRSKSWWIRLFNLAYCNTRNDLIHCMIVSRCVWCGAALLLQVRTLRTVLAYWAVSWDILCHSFIQSAVRPRGRSQSLTAQLPTVTTSHCRTVKAGLRYPRSCHQTTVRTILLYSTPSLPLDTGLNWGQITLQLSYKYKLVHLNNATKPTDWLTVKTLLKEQTKVQLPLCLSVNECQWFDLRILYCIMSS